MVARCGRQAIEAAGMSLQRNVNSVLRRWRRDWLRLQY